jgi:hypothetical protein
MCNVTDPGPCPKRFPAQALLPTHGFTAMNVTVEERTLQHHHRKTVELAKSLPAEDDERKVVLELDAEWQRHKDVELLWR